jgi:uncharacterized membrane protein
MIISFKKYPLDILICLIWSFILLPLTLFDIGGIIRSIFGFIFAIFIPGYVLVFTLFPTKKTDKGISVLQRTTLSLGFSIAIVSLIGFGLNYTPWGIQLESVSFFLIYFVLIFSFLGYYRWLKIPQEKRFIPSFDTSALKSENKMDKTLIILIAISLVIVGMTIIYIVVNPKEGEHYTELYFSTINGRPEGYKKNLTIGEQVSGIIGIFNHEYQTINYTIEIWLINQTIYYNQSTGENQSIYNHMWFINKTTVILPHMNIDVEKTITNLTQWKTNYSFFPQKTGSFKITFLLYTTPTDEYSTDTDYKDIAAQKISSAYRELHLWINVS